MKAPPTPIRSSVVETQIGSIIISCSTRGVIALELPNENCDVQKSLVASKLGHVTWEECEISRECGSQLVSYFEGKSFSFDEIPLDIDHRSDFEKATYHALRKTECGDTISYGQLAKLAGYPNAARAVGRAMATNLVPVLVPCHRVILAGGKLGKYSGAGGEVFKQQLLTLEKSYAGD